MKDLLEKGHNCLLFALGPADGARWRTQLEMVRLEQDQVLCLAGYDADYLYFPIDAQVAMINTHANGNQTLIAVIGDEGCAGVAAIMTGMIKATAVVQTPGRAWRIRTEYVKREFRTSVTVLEAMMRYTQGLFSQVVQMAACHQFHTLEQQMCRWLLDFDRGGNFIAITHQVMADRLGVRRETVTAAAKKLVGKGHISAGRGRMSVVNRAGLETCSCECYALAQNTITHMYD